MDTAAAAAQVYGENASSGEGQLPVDKMCRLCCSEGLADLSLLFPEDSTDEANKLLLRKIYECTTVQIVNEGDDQNAMICEACIAKIDDFYSYREQCRANDDRIRQQAAVVHHAVPEIHIKQEKDLQLEINEPTILAAACEDGFQQQEDSSHPRPTTTTATTTTTTTSNELHDPEHESVGKDEESLLQPMGSKHHNPPDLTDEITIKREVIVDDDEVYYNSDGEAVSVPTHLKENEESHKPAGFAGASSSSINSSGKKSNYRIIMTPTNRERLVYQGYLYCRHFSRRDGSVHWRCRLGGCQAAVNLNLDNSITPANNNKHSHAQNAPFEGGVEEDESHSSLPLQSDNTALLESFGIHYGDDDMDLDDASVNLSELTSVGEESLRIVPNKKKGETLVHLGFKYCKRYVKMDGSTYWKCRSNNNKCSAGLYVYPEAKVRYHGTHNHEKVVGDEYDPDSTLDDSLMQPFTIVEDVEDDEEGEQDYNDDMAALLTPSVEVMMPDERKHPSSADYEVTTNVKGRECLIYEGHQYSKDRERYDGAVLWRCRRNYDKCRAVAIIYVDGRIEKSGEHRHETDKRYLERQEQGIGSRMFRITKNQRGNDALVFEGHRFSKEWSRVDGSIIWRCSYRSGMCRVKVVLNAEAYIHRMGAEHEHDHEQTEAPVTVEYSDEDVEVMDDSLLTPARSQPKLSLLPQVPQCPNFTAEQQMAGGYRIVKNRKGFEALVHDGYRYCKVRVRQDGSIKWLCKMNKKTCRAAVDLFPDGSIAKATDYDHNHERPNDMDTMDDDDDNDVPGQEITYPIDPEVFGNSQWYYVKNSKNGISMIHAGYRYTKKCERVDGTSLWRCSASQRGCKAGVILFPNDTLAMVENAEHSHKPSENVKPADYEQDSEEQDKSQSDVIDISEQDDGGDEPDMNMHSLLQTVLGGDDVTWMGGDANESNNEQGNESVWFNSTTDRPYPRPPKGQTPDFRIIKNRRNTDSLVHRGYRYCKIRDRVDGSILWTCQMNKKTCKASVNLTVDGRVEVINAGHNHEKTDHDDGDGRDIPTDQNVAYDISSDVDLTVDDVQDEPEEVPPPVLKHPDYYYSVNKSNNECLIHKGHRMSKRSERPDGTTTWRCSMNGNTCMAGVIIHPDGRPEENPIKHNHQPLLDLPPEIERVVKAPPAPAPQPVQPDIKEPNKAPMAYKRQGDSLEWDAFHYRKIKELPDGCIIWICNVDSCRVAVKMLPGGQLKMLSESEHNHTASGQPLSQASSSAGTAKPSAAPTSEGRARSYRLFKNQRGQMTLLYQGYRYSIRNRNQDGSSSWKCRSNSSCRAIIFLMPDDRIVQGNNNAGHNHDPNWESTKKLESIAPARVNPLYDYLNIVPGGSNSRPPSSAAKTQEPAVSSASDADADTKPQQEVNYGRNVVEHKNYFYRLIVRKKNGREYWRCVHFKNRSCRAALFCRDNGTIVTSTNGKEHNHKCGADARPQPPAQFANSAHKIKADAASMGLLEASRSNLQPSPLEEVHLTDIDEERYIDHGDYVIAKNRKDQNTLIYKDRRYYLSYNRSDGSAVWRCAHRKRYKCYAYVRLRPDGRLLSTGEQDHSHSQKTEYNPPAAEAKPVKNYKIVKNRVGNDILIHENHRFRLNYQRNDGTTHWRCVWARSNHCSAGVYLFANGVLKNAANESAIVHNHPPPSQVRKAVNVNATVEPKPGPSSTQPQFNATDKRTIPEDEGITDFKFVEEGFHKVLVCRGYRYWYTWVRKDGSIYYRCAMVKKLQCTMGILLLKNGKLVRAGDQCHNHDPSQEEEDNEVIAVPVEVEPVREESQMEDEVIEQYAPLVIPPGGDSDFKIAKTSRGESLIYQGYRYWAKNRLATGIVSLCCTRKKMKKCPAMLRLLTNGRVTDPVGAGHTHPPNIEGGGDISMLQPVSVTLTPRQVQPKPAIIPKEPSFVVKPSVPPSQLPALTFNEESEDDTEEGEEAILGSKRYTFMKSSAQRNLIVFEDFVYDFEHKQHDGCVFYRCKTSEACPASLMLLSNGRVMHLADSMHSHLKPDLSILRPVGRGSKEFKIVQNKNGSNILVHRGHRYTTPRSKTDGAGIWYCHTYVPEINRRCYVPIELLPNGRVAPVGDKQHSHNPPFKTKPESGMGYDSKDTVVKAEHSNGAADSKVANNRMLLHGGHRYNFANKRDDGAILWKCIEKSCNASMYRLTDGHIVKGPEHNHDRMETLDSSSKRKLSDYETTKHKNPSPSVTDGDSKLSSTPEPVASYPRAGTAVKPNPYIGKPIIHEGYRYIYYLTRRDGSEHWRCSRRLPMKCRGGLYKLTDGSLIKSNEEGHSHPPYVNMDDSASLSFAITEMSQESYDDTAADVEEVVEEALDTSATSADQTQVSFVDDEGSYDYELIDVKGRKRGMYLIHKGAMFVAGHTRRDRARYYRCRTAGCKVAMLLHRNGLLMRSNEHTHDCQNAVKTEEPEKEDDEEVQERENGNEPSNKKQRLENDEVEDDAAALVANGDEDTVVEVKEEPADEH